MIWNTISLCGSMKRILFFILFIVLRLIKHFCRMIIMFMDKLWDFRVSSWNIRLLYDKSCFDHKFGPFFPCRLVYFSLCLVRASYCELILWPSLSLSLRHCACALFSYHDEPYGRIKFEYFVDRNFHWVFT